MKKTPYDRAAAWHAKHGGAIEFSDIVEFHAGCGYVIITPEIFLLARQVRSYWSDELMSLPWRAVEDGDCWHVWLMAGDWQGWERFLPYPLPFVSMHRREKLRVYPLERFRRLK